MFAADLSWTEDKGETIRDRRKRKEKEARQAPSTASDSSSQKSFEKKPRAPQWKLNLPFNKSRNASLDNVDLYFTVRTPFGGTQDLGSPVMDELSPRPSLSKAVSTPELSPSSTSFDKDSFRSFSTNQSESHDSGIRVNKLVTVTVEKMPSGSARQDRFQFDQATSYQTRISANSISVEPGLPLSERSIWNAPTDWGVKKKSLDGQTAITSPYPSPPATTVSHFESSKIQPNRPSPETNPGLRQFQRMTKLLESAKPSIVLDELERERDEAEGSVVIGDLQVERLMCALIAIEGNTLEGLLEEPERRDVRTPQTTAQATNLLFDANIVDVYRAILTNPESTTTYISASPAPSPSPTLAPLISHHLSLRPDSSNPFPLSLPPSSISSIFSSTLPARLPSSAIPLFFAESFRLLKPTGTLHLRLLNALPLRQSLGPRLAAWLEHHLVIPLESACRCSRPYDVFPRWATAAGFAVPTTTSTAAAATGGGSNSFTRVHTLPATANEGAPAEARLGAAVLREVWRDVWGACVVFGAGEAHRFWWEEEEIVRECGEMGTAWQVGWFEVAKPEVVKLPV